jgi:hypothetical protein
MTNPRALALLENAGFDRATAERLLDLLAQGGITLADATNAEFVCRWVNVLERPVPPEADTIIRTVTRSSGEHSQSSTHWLLGIVAPPAPGA